MSSATRGEGRAETPGHVIELFSQRLNAGDLEGVLSLYEAEAIFAPEPGASVSGLEAIREALTGFLALSPTITGQIQKVLEADGIALVTNRWSLSGRRPDGEPITMEGVSADVVRRQPDGSWRVLVDDPWGAVSSSGP